MDYEFSEIDLRRLDLNLLLVFSALMRARGVKRASKRLFLGPSAVSMALGRLRDLLGDELFVRASAGMEPTPLAEQLWAALEPALGQIDAALRDVRRFDPGTAELTFCLAAPDDLEFVLVPRLLERLAADAPGVTLVVRPSDFQTLLDRLDRSDTDLALSATPTRGIERRHRTWALYREGFSVLYDRERLGLRGDLGLDAYLRTPHLMLSVSGELRGPIDDALERIGQSRKLRCAVSHFPTIPFILKAQAALATLPSTAAHYFARTFDLELTPPPLVTPSFEVSLAWHARTDADPAHCWFRSLVAEIVQAIHKGAETEGR